MQSLTKGLVQSTNTLAKNVRKQAIRRSNELKAELESLAATNPQLAKAVAKSEEPDPLPEQHPRRSEEQ